MKRSHFFTALFVLSVVVYACSKSNETDVRARSYGTLPSDCDTAHMSFTTDIKPILQTYCYACHSNANYAISGARLEDYSDVVHHVEDGDILGTITHAAGFPAMPQDGPKLSDCNINKIKAWINAGAINN